MGTRGSHGEGTVWWITGLSGAGKSTIGHLVRDALSARGRPSLLIDGDVMRTVLDDGGSYGPEDRRRLAMTYGRLAREVARQGIDAVCTTISLFSDVHEWNRLNIPRYREIYLRVPLSELEQRDPRGLYAKARQAHQVHIVGIDLPFDEPSRPDLVIDNFGAMSAPEAAARILSLEAS